MGSIRVREREPFYVNCDGSVAIVYGVVETEEAAEAARAVVSEIVAATGAAVVVLIDQATAHIYTLLRARVEEVMANG